jgi:aryl-alcohol dehydrogenase-like predicted oxidoreductase
VPEVEQDRVIERALALGVTLFETADAYGQGAMEKRLGARVPVGGSARIVTKIGTDRTSEPPLKRFEPAFVRDAFERSRERLGRSVVDIVLLHNPAEITVARGESTAVLAELKERGALLAWGVSAGSAEVARAAIARGADVVSLSHNALFARDVNAVRDDLMRSGAGLLVHSVLAHGLLCGYWSLHKEFPPTDHRTERWTSDDLARRIRQLTALHTLMGTQVRTLRGAALRYVLSDEQVSTAILGPRSALQLDQLVREAGSEPPYLPDGRLRQYAHRLEGLGVRT